ncbi:MAG: AI-2E family transporter [Acidimicrobiales bacterium]|nr:AI-2E family transporter [Acidimicrobiales bacterium]
MREYEAADRSADATVAPVDKQTAPTAAKLSVPIWLDRSAGWAWRLLLIGAVGVAVLWIFSLIRLAVVPFLIATMFAAALQPPIEWLCKHRIPRNLAVVLVFVLSLVLLVGPAAFAVQSAAVELSHVDDDYARVRAEIDRWLIEGPIGLSREEIIKAEETIRDSAIGGIRRFGSSRGSAILSLASGALLLLVLTFLFAKDGSAMWNTATRGVNSSRRKAINEAGSAAIQVMASYARAIFTTGFIDAVLIGLGLWVLGVPLVVPLMILTFIAALFPVVGAVTAGLAATAVALILVGPSTAIWVAGWSLVVQQLEGNVVMPLVMGRTVNIHPAIVLLSLTAGATLAGLAGAFLGVPVVAAGMAAIAAFSQARVKASDLPPVSP